ncbi:Sjoegren syndrome nuclear autoantigen 1 isoform X1 [Numida meleagris]|uniref:Sjoegren syndrome nuclear autoantigen 1 isoform X1 n=1 Tax=Numida meleagris TaxID=8996 RepID=UPI000B3E2781|nr:Sjoegren syndrome nuclear autoantigen 1 isoform X1 [Numida meleagris]
MSGAGEALQGYNAALLEGLAELRARRDELSGRIREEEAERGRLQGRIAALTERLARSSERLARHLAARRQLDASIAESEAAYGKAALRGGAAPSLQAAKVLSAAGAVRAPVPCGEWDPMAFKVPSSSNNSVIP